MRNPTNDWNWVQNPSSSNKNEDALPSLEPGIHGVESRIQDCLGFPYMEWFEYYILSLKGTTWVQEIVWQIYHNGEVNSKRIEDRVPFLEEATNSKSSQPDIASLPSPRLIKVSVKENEVPTEKNSSRESIFVTKASYISN